MFDSIDVCGQEDFLISWDLGPRCNYDCSYCPSHRHDKVSKHASLEELKKSADFVFEYAALITQYRISKKVFISFTGGEPTVNPKFVEFSKYVRQRYTELYSTKFDLNLDLTTNGAMNEKTAQAVIDNFDHVTISYHTEAENKLKRQVLKRIMQFHGSIGMKVNVMLHAQHFEECKYVMEYLNTSGVKFIPRAIGEDPDGKRIFAQEYTQEQKEWFNQFWKIPDASIGRPCCGGRTFKVINDSEVKEVKFINYRKFEGWSCSVNWYFLHIEQQSDSVYHHQTCQARFDNTRGPIGKISEGSIILEELRTRLETNTMPIITCPNTFCGCGLCTPKSSSKQNLLELLPNTVLDTSIFSCPTASK